MTETDAGRAAGAARRREPLTRERIIEAALRLMDDEGLDAVTMRRLGRELGVEAMSLYNHVEDKEAILAGLLEAVLSELEIPERKDDWTELLREGARNFRALLLRHPHAIRLFTEKLGPVLSPGVVRPIEAVLRTLRRAGMSEQDTVHAYRTLAGYVLGYATQEVTGLFARADALELAPGAVGQTLPAQEFPTFVELLPEMVRCDPDEDFEYGLDVLLHGLREKVLLAGGRGGRRAAR